MRRLAALLFVVAGCNGQTAYFGITAIASPSGAPVFSTTILVADGAVACPQMSAVSVLENQVHNNFVAASGPLSVGTSSGSGTSYDAPTQAVATFSATLTLTAVNAQNLPSNAQITGSSGSFPSVSGSIDGSLAASDGSVATRDFSASHCVGLDTKQTF